MKGSLCGVKILDFTRLLPGPFGTQVLGDLGADLIKVEDLGIGDHTRVIPPVKNSVSAFYCAINRNKRSVRINLKKPEGLQIVHRLVGDQGYDVVIESFRPGVAERLGIDYESLRAVAPPVIQASLPGFGHGSRKRDFAAHDLNLLALAGALSTSGNDSTGPVIHGIQMDDLATGLYMVIGVLAALLHRDRTGEGQRVEVPMADTALALNAMYLVSAAVEDKAPGFRNHPLTGMCISYQIYRTKDGRYLSVGAVEPKFWINACRAFDLPELLDQQLAFAVDGQDAFEKIKARIADKTQAEWQAIFEDVDACVEPVLDNLEALNYPHFHDRGMVRTVQHPTEGDMTAIGLPIRLSGTPASMDRHPPLLGEHTDEVLTEARYDAEAIAEFRRKGIVG